VKHREERFLAKGPNEAWRMDFVADQLQDGRRFRALKVVDVFTRESVAIEVGQSLKGEDVVRTLNGLKHGGQTPRLSFCDIGSEFSGQAMDLCAYQNGVKIDSSRPGKPTDNAFVESFNGTFRDECLNFHWFETLAEAKQLIEARRKEYNGSRPNRALEDLTPSEFVSQLTASRQLTATQTCRRRNYSALLTPQLCINRSGSPGRM
jgi:putative transposase